MDLEDMQMAPHLRRGRHRIHTQGNSNGRYREALRFARISLGNEMKKDV